MNTTTMRVEALRAWMKRNDLEAFVVPTADPHGSEYLPDYWKCREWLSGFTGSAGTAVVTLRGAALWTDSRYYLQAAQELENSPFELMREGTEGVPQVGEWLCEQRVEVVGGNGALLSEDFAETLAEQGKKSFSFRFTDDPFCDIWNDRPALPKGKIVPQSAIYTSRSAKEKLQLLSNALDKDEWLLLSDLSEIAWTLNLRGSDITYNPVFLSYLLVSATKDRSVLFVDEEKLNSEAAHSLSAAGVAVRPYDGLAAVLMELGNSHETICYEGTLTYSMKQLIAQASWSLRLIADGRTSLLKAVKDEGEQAGFRLAMERDGVALIRFRRWLDEALLRGDDLTEQEIDRRLTALRAEQAGFTSLSFATIAAAGEHGAIVHYEAEPTKSTPLPSNGFLLLDSGAQYDCGTTDITRTIPLGQLTDEERRVYTLVLKAHIGLARLRFPEGTNGLQADTAARAPLWHAGYDFGHGTGHGVGSHLCVHEGPHQIRKDKRACTMVALQPGMTITDEPGVYLEGRFGVRLENVLMVRKDADGFLSFEALTLCPFDTAPIIQEMLTHEERAYLNAYHAEVRHRLLPLLSDEADKQWLIAATGDI